MFTGIIQETGEITKIEKHAAKTTFEVTSKKAITGKKIGESIAINGACMTITQINEGSFTFDTITESLKKTNLSKLKKGDKVNLEPTLTLNQGIDGHLVLGHVDTTTEVIELSTTEKETKLTIKIPADLKQHIAYKGSITINGASLTISELTDDTLSVNLIPLTLEITNFAQLKPGDLVNIEIDMISRYLERLLQNREQQTKYQFLKERNLI